MSFHDKYYFQSVTGRVYMFYIYLQSKLFCPNLIIFFGFSKKTGGESHVSFYRQQRCQVLSLLAFTRKRVQILTSEDQCARDSNGKTTYFTITKYKYCYLYWYKSTNNDTSAMCQGLQRQNQTGLSLRNVECLIYVIYIHVYICIHIYIYNI